MGLTLTRAIIGQLTLTKYNVTKPISKCYPGILMIFNSQPINPYTNNFVLLMFLESTLVIYMTNTTHTPSYCSSSNYPPFTISLKTTIRICSFAASRLGVNRRSHVSAFACSLSFPPLLISLLRHPKREIFEINK